jgi:hypothetical protein
MKFRLLLPVLILFLMAACGGPSNYGIAVNESEAITVDELVNRLEEEKSFTATVTGRVENACHGEGCWLELQDNNGSLVMVTYKDKAFHLPTGIEGRTVVMTGTAFIDSVSVEDLQAEAKKAGKTEDEILAINQPEYSLQFEATGLILKEK